MKLFNVSTELKTTSAFCAKMNNNKCLEIHFYFISDGNINRYNAGNPRFVLFEILKYFSGVMTELGTTSR